MGRSKSIPIQQSSQSEEGDRNDTTTSNGDDEVNQHHVPLLGRRIFVETAALQYHRRREELVDDDEDDDDDGTLDAQITTHPEDIRHDDHDMADRPSHQRPPRKRSVSSSKQTTTTSSSSSLPASSYPSTLTSLVQRIEQQEQEKKLQRRQQQQRSGTINTSSSKSKTKIVHFNGDNTHNNDPIPMIIPPPEIRFVAKMTLLPLLLEGSETTATKISSSHESHDHPTVAAWTIPSDDDDDDDDFHNTRMEQVDTISSNGEDTMALLIHKSDHHQYHSHLVDDTSQPSTQYWLLSEYTIPHTSMVFQRHSDMDVSVPHYTTHGTFPITTKQGTMDIWNYIQQQSKTRGNPLHISALGCSVESGILRLNVFQEHVSSERPQPDIRLQIAISQTAISDLCHKDQMKPSIFDKICRLTNGSVDRPSILKKNDEVHRRRKRHRQSSSLRPKLSIVPQQQIYDLFLALALLFPNTEIADVLVDGGNHTTKHRNNYNHESKTIITAQQVYALTDNVQLNHAYHFQNDDDTDHKQPGTDLSIPGLLPTLRPYQCKAVEWMLRREQSPQSSGGNITNSDDEWELVWIVLSSELLPPNHIRQAIPHAKHVTQQPELLPLWKLKNRVEQNENTLNLLLFCPFTGWMTNSIQQAKEWTIGPISKTASISGGILAESMGLGKTVEVLACILANPRNTTSMPPRNTSTVVTSALDIHSGTKRQLNFNNDAVSPAIYSKSGGRTFSNVIKDERTTMTIVDNLNDFCDAEIDSDNDSESQLSVLPIQASCSEVEDGNLTTSKLSHIAVQVTPIKVSHESIIEERWTESDILGACICGNLIGFDTRNGKDAVIICQSCNEPMHTNCAAFDSVEAMIANTRLMHYRHTFTNSTLNCRLCEGEQCPCCVDNLTSGATLIITPPAILNQWEREILRHTRSTESSLPLKVVIYDGVKRMTQSHSVRNDGNTIKYIHPRHLASADVVLMTFDALMNDLGHTDDNQFVSRGTEYNQSSALRKRKRYRVVPSPILSIKWWRVCLDEAQRVETPTAGSAQMALKLDAVHRWCISGTPIQRGNLNDLYGLLLFLRLEPFWDKVWFQKCFNPSNRNTQERIKHLLHSVFWRSTKASKLVRDQMGIPEQIEKKIMLKFSSIEKHFYDRQLEQTILAANDVSNLSGPAIKRKSSRLLLLTDQLHKLRAACCHPQVGSSGITSVKRNRNKNGDNSVSSRVMTMSQILDKFIDDAKIQCEESQRLVVLYTNGMAAVSRLKVEAKCRGVNIPESDSDLLEKCCQLYDQSLRLADENSVPTLVLGEVELTGSSGFRTPGKITDNYTFSLEWQKFGAEHPQNSVWTRFEVPFGSSRKLTQVRARSYNSVPINVVDDSSADFKWHLLFPKDCTFQCIDSTGEFVNVHSFSLPHADNNNEWILANGFRTNKSKAWRLVVDTFYPSHITASRENDCNSFGTFIGIEFECYEAAIANDPLQRLHCLHNASQAYNSLAQLKSFPSTVEDSEQVSNVDDATGKVSVMMKEARKIESLYLDGVRSNHKECQRWLGESAAIRLHLEKDLCELSRSANSRASIKDCWDDCWWDDFLVLCHLYGTEAQHTAICNKIRQDLDGMISERFGIVNQNEIIAFPMFEDIAGLRTALQLRIRDIRDGLGSTPTRRKHQPSPLGQTDDKAPLIPRFRCTEGGHSLCMQSVLDLTEFPPEEEIRENSRCRECKADWLQTGPKCRHCKIGDTLAELLPDKVTIQILNAVYSLVKGSIGSALIQSFGNASFVANRAKIFYDVLDACKKERSIAFRLWRTHLNLLNDIDELNQCKSTMRLRNENEDVTELSKEQLNAIVEPVDVNTAYHQYAAKQAMAFGALSRSKGTLQYLKNLSVSERETISANASEDENGRQTCLICLSKFDTERAVLRCGHGFHLSPCLEQLRARSGAGNIISCPLRCTTRTMFDEVMIAAADGTRHDDGSHTQRHIKGSYGTKVTRLVSDVLDVRDLGEKGIVFSQWEDMLDICEHALVQNGVQFVRATSLRKIGACTQQFREPECSIMLLNVKNGAEGLTLVEATHVFMVEPLLNCGLDIQAINRIHRIGQNRKTYVWRYIVADTVEVKIDQLRMKHQEDQIDEDDSMIRGGSGHDDGTTKTILIQAGGIDGGFRSQEEVFELLQS